MADQKYLKNLRVLSVLEGISTLLLFGVAMPIKYLGGIPLAVSVVGPIHGVLFMALAVTFIKGIERIPISRGLATAGIVAAVFPFGPFVMDRRLGRLGDTS